MGGLFSVRASSVLVALLLLGCRTFGGPEAEDDTGTDEVVEYPAIPIADSYVDQLEPSANNGDLAWGIVRNGSGYTEGWGMELLVAFNWETLPVEEAIDGISSARLRLYYAYFADSDPAGRELTAHRIDEPWDEATVSWSDRPASDPAPTATAIVPQVASCWIEWDVTDDINNDLTMYDPCHGWVIRAPEPWGDSDIPMLYFQTKEAGGYAPTLLVTP